MVGAAGAPVGQLLSDHRAGIGDRVATKRQHYSIGEQCANQITAELISPMRAAAYVVLGPHVAFIHMDLRNLLEGLPILAPHVYTGA